MKAAAAVGPTTGRGRAADTARTAAGVAAIVTLSAAVTVIVFGVLVTSGVYGSRLAWLFGVALPLLALTMLLSWLSTPALARPHHGANAATSSRRQRIARGVFLTALSLFGLPLVLTLMLVGAYALVFAVHGLSLLL
jgi:hypothetical protein